jgi:threonine synthase
MAQTNSTLTHLECGACGKIYEPNQLLNLCTDCGKPLLARYDLSVAALTLTREALQRREPSLWRYEEVLPVQNDWAQLRLGEGWTPLHHARRLGERRSAAPTPTSRTRG